MEIMSHSDLLNRGWSPFDVQRQIRRRELVRLCRGVYARRADVPSEEEMRHRLSALGHARRSDYAVSHVSAAVLHGLPVGGADLREVHVTRIGRGGQRHVAGRRVHSSPLDPRWCTVVDGVLVTTVARTLADLFKVESLQVAVSTADAALFQKKCTRSDLDMAMAELKFHAGGPLARRAAALVDGCAESPGETRTRLLVNAGPLPKTDLQISVFDEQGRFVGRGDGGYPELGVLWEYDGKGKYERLLRLGQTPLVALLAEKKREERITELGWVVIRIDAADLRDPDRLVQRILAAIARSRRPGWLPPRGTYRIQEPIM
jgi:hypothetical protein